MSCFVWSSTITHVTPIFWLILDLPFGCLPHFQWTVSLPIRLLEAPRWAGGKKPPELPLLPEVHSSRFIWSREELILFRKVQNNVSWATRSWVIFIFGQVQNMSRNDHTVMTAPLPVCSANLPTKKWNSTPKWDSRMKLNAPQGINICDFCSAFPWKDGFSMSFVDFSKSQNCIPTPALNILFKMATHKYVPWLPDRKHHRHTILWSIVWRSCILIRRILKSTW